MPDWVQILFRSLGALSVLFLFTRILGKKQISQLSFFEYVMGITLGELAGFVSTDIEKHYFYGILAMSVWFFIPFSMEWLLLKSQKLRIWFEGRGTILVKEGKVLESNLKKERLSADELMEQLRGKNVFNVADVEFAVMETNGKLSVLLKKSKLPLTASDVGIKTVNEVEPQAVIIDGNIMTEPLSTLGLSPGWLKTELQKVGVAPENVFLGQVDAYQQLYVDLYDDKLKVPLPQGKALVMATLKKTQADLELFALSAKNPDAKKMFENNAQSLDKLIRDLKPVLQG
ncbi:DUF421 domain-containing protein [Cohnella pontilimi]|uniref:DUF421 domain-containing protein n=1 Tax=Cohnella pontilimi TaxID=2564100 RepID=A0A4V5LRK7_9BACL|nr:DUF421 domain-containing protein [Cohnella pontilimi]TJY39639.1 DUF421 domain-containing protein [Cohnella pontilimi]